MRADHLGSTRLVTGSATERHDYEPYGAELNLSGTWRSGVSGYGTASGIRPMFTGQERDSGTLDYFIARYYVPDQGRFMSVDPGNAGANPADPQTWNGYAYVSNNPLTFTDPSGLGWGWLKWVGIGASAVGAVFTGGASAIFGFAAAGTSTASTVGTALMIAGSAAELGGVIADNVGGGGNGLPGQTRDISGLSGGWWSQCGFLYGTVCGIAPANVFFNIDPTGGLMPVFRGQGTGKMPKDPIQPQEAPIRPIQRTEVTNAKPGPTPPWSTCLFAPHDFVQMAFGPKQGPSDPLVGNGNEIPWQPTTRGYKQMADPNGQALGGGYAGLLNIFANTFADCSLRFR